jgi:hypothetical protein
MATFNPTHCSNQDRMYHAAHYRCPDSMQRACFRSFLLSLWVSLHLQELSCDSLQFRFIVCYCPLLDAISVSKLRFRSTFTCSIFASGDILKISDCVVCLVCDGRCGRNGGCTGLYHC